MTDLVPDQLFTLEELKDWSTYEKNLNAPMGRSYIRKYLLPLFKKWLKILPNPFVVDWMEHLFLNHGQFLFQFDQITLKTLQDELTEPLFRTILAELVDQNHTDLGMLYQNIDSMWGETHAAKGLMRLGKTITKISQGGDFTTDKEVFSVKTALGMDNNYKLLERSLRSMLHLKEHGFLRNYNSVRFVEQRGMDYEFRTTIFQFFEKRLSQVLAEYDAKIQVREPVKGQEMFGNAKVEFLAWKDGTDHIDLTFRDERSGKDGHIRVFFEKDKSFPWAYRVHEDSDSWWITTLSHDNKFRDDLKHKIASKVDSMKREFDVRADINRTYIGWINIETHVMHDDYKKEKEELLKFFKEAIGNQPFAVYLYFGSQWWHYDDSRLFLFEVA